MENPQTDTYSGHGPPHWRQRGIAVLVCGFLAYWGIVGLMSTPFSFCPVMRMKEYVWAVDYQLGRPEVNTLREKCSAVGRGIQIGASTEQYFKTLCKNIPKPFFVNIYGGTLRCLGKNRVQNDTFRLNNGHLLHLYATPENISESANQLIAFQRWLAERDFSFLFIQAPSKSCPYDTQLPRGLRDTNNSCSDVFLSRLREEGIDVLDARDFFCETPARHYELFFQGDTHWKAPYAFYIFAEMAKKLNQKYSFSIPSTVYDLQNYRREEYVKMDFDLIKRSGSWYTSRENAVFLFPKFATHLEYQTFRSAKQISGPFDPRLFDPLRTISTWNSDVPDKKILLITDSFGKAFRGFPALICHELTCLPLNQLEEKQESIVKNIHQYILEEKPDIVILLLVIPREKYIDYLTPPGYLSGQ